MQGPAFLCRPQERAGERAGGPRNRGGEAPRMAKIGSQAPLIPAVLETSRELTLAAIAKVNTIKDLPGAYVNGAVTPESVGAAIAGIHNEIFIRVMNRDY